MRLRRLGSCLSIISALLLQVKKAAWNLQDLPLQRQGLFLVPAGCPLQLSPVELERPLACASSQRLSQIFGHYPSIVG